MVGSRGSPQSERAYLVKHLWTKLQSRAQALQHQLELMQSTKASVKAAEPVALPPLKHGAKIRELRLRPELPRRCVNFSTSAYRRRGFPCAH